MTEMYQWGIDVINIIQRMESPVFTGLMRFISGFGSQTFYVPLLLVIFWWIDEKRGLRLGALVIISAWINLFLKDLFKLPRPFHLEPSLGLVFVPGFGLPSGHAQVSLCFWVPVAAWMGNVWKRRRTVIWTAVLFLVVLIAYTRLYLGVHFPTDIIAGWIAASIILVILYFAGPHIERVIIAGGPRLQNICAAGIALVMNGLFPRERSLPAIFLGFCLGYTMMKRRFPFSAQGEINGKKPGIHVMILRCFVGFAGTAILYLGLSFIFPGEDSLFRDFRQWSADSPFYDLGYFIRYGFLGFWASAGAPQVFQRMGLAQAPGDSL